MSVLLVWGLLLRCGEQPVMPAVLRAVVGFLLEPARPPVVLQLQRCYSLLSDGGEVGICQHQNRLSNASFKTCPRFPMDFAGYGEMWPVFQEGAVTAESCALLIYLNHCVRGWRSMFTNCHGLCAYSLVEHGCQGYVGDGQS